MQHVHFIMIVYVIIPYFLVEIYCGLKTGALLDVNRIPWIVIGDFFGIIGACFVTAILGTTIHFAPIIGILILLVVALYQWGFNKFFISWVVDDDEFVMMGAKFEPLITIIGSLMVATAI